MPADQNGRDVGRGAARDGGYDGPPGGGFVACLDFFRAEGGRDRDLQVRQVGMSGAHYGDGAVSLRPCGGPRRMGVDYAANPGQILIEHQVSGGIGGWAELPLPPLPHRAPLQPCRLPS